MHHFAVGGRMPIFAPDERLGARLRGSLIKPAFPSAGRTPTFAVMQMHGSCAARAEAGVLLLGPPGSGKSDLVLRLLDRGFTLVADDRVIVEGLSAAAPASLAGLLEIRGLGVMRMPWLSSCRLALVVMLGEASGRLPWPERHATLALPMVRIDATAASAAQRVELALDAALGRLDQLAGAFRA